MDLASIFSRSELLNLESAPVFCIIWLSAKLNQRKGTKPQKGRAFGGTKMENELCAKMRIRIASIQATPISRIETQTD